MMPFAGHAGLSLVIAGLFNLNPLLVLIGGLIPDLDSLFVFFSPGFTKYHRKITHSLLFLNLILVSAVFFPIMIPIVIGLSAHYIVDLDHWGIPLFYPFSEKRYSVMKVTNKKAYDKGVDCVSDWFKKRGVGFWLEWILLGLGITLTWSYWVNLLNYLLVLFS